MGEDNMTAHHGYTNAAGQVVIAGSGAFSAPNPANNGVITIANPYPLYQNIGPILGQPPMYTSEYTEDHKTSLEVFEDLVGLIRQLEAQLGLNTKDVNKDRWLYTVMGRIQEDAINSTIQRLKALNL